MLFEAFDNTLTAIVKKKNSMHLPSLAIISQGLKKEINC